MPIEFACLVTRCVCVCVCMGPSGDDMLLCILHVWQTRQRGGQPCVRVQLMTHAPVRLAFLCVAVVKTYIMHASCPRRARTAAHHDARSRCV